MLFGLRARCSRLQATPVAAGVKRLQSACRVEGVGPGAQPGPGARGALDDDPIPVALRHEMLQNVCRWNGSDLDHNQDPARQALCDYLDFIRVLAHSVRLRLGHDRAFLLL